MKDGPRDEALEARGRPIGDDQGDEEPSRRDGRVALQARGHLAQVRLDQNRADGRVVELDGAEEHQAPDFEGVTCRLTGGGPRPGSPRTAHLPNLKSTEVPPAA